MRKLLLGAFLCSVGFMSYGQCPSGNYTGDVNISSNCTIASSLTITGNLTISNSATLTVNTGVVLAITGNIQSGYQAGTILVNGGGTINAGGRFYNQVRNSTSFTFSNVTVTVNNSSSVTVLNDYTSSMSLLNGTSFTVVQGGFENDNQTDLIIDNSSLTINAGNFLNDYQSSLTVQNGGEVTLVNGNFKTEDQSSFSVDASDVYINGDFNNDYNASLDVTNGSTFVVTGDFNNGYNPDGGEVTVGHVNINGSSVSVGGDFNNDYGSDVSVDGGGALAVDGNVSNDQAASIDVGDGTFSYGGTMTDPHGGVSSASGDSECADGCCGSGCGSLPVELTFFEANEVMGDVILKWETASELNNDFFNIHRSADGVNFSVRDKVYGQGTSVELNSYEWVDYNVESGTFYYQLEQVDFDGSHEKFDIIRVDVTGRLQALEVFPVPVSASGDIYTSRIESESVSASLQELSGGKSYQLENTVELDRIRFHTANLSLSPGIYVFTLRTSTHEYVRKIIVNN